MSTVADVVAGHLASLPVLARGPALRAALATSRAQLAGDEPQPEQLAVVADRLLRGLHVDAASAARLEGNRALVQAIEAHLADLRFPEVAAIREHLEGEADRLQRQAEERLAAEAARCWAKRKPDADPVECRRIIRVHLVLTEPNTPPEVEAWQSIHAQLRERHGADLVAAAAVPFAMPDVHALVDQVTKEA